MSAVTGPDAWKWLATPDERVLWTIVGAAALLALWGVVSGWLRSSKPD